MLCSNRSFFLKFRSNLLVKCVFFLLNAAFAMAILDLILRVHLASFIIMLPTYLTYSTFPSFFCSTIICNGDGSLEILITLFACSTEQITCPPISKSPNPSRALLVRHSLYKLNKIGNKQHPCLTHLPVFTIPVSPWSSHTLTMTHVKSADQSSFMPINTRFL